MIRYMLIIHQKYVTVKNNPPTVSVDNKEIKVKEGEEIIVCGKVVGKDIIGVEYSLGEAYRQVILFNNNEFKINLGELKKGTYTLFVRGVDEEENHSDDYGAGTFWR